MKYSQKNGWQIGRIVTGDERTARMANEAAAALAGETLRSAFAISERFILTAWHAIKQEYESSESLWFRLRRESPGSRVYTYLPVRVTNYDELFDVAALTFNPERLTEVNISAAAALELLTEIAIPLGADVGTNDQMQVMGFPVNHTSADSDTNSARVVAVRVPLGNVTGLKLFGEAFAAASPVDPRGMSGGPVLRTSHESGESAYQAVAIIRAAPRGSMVGVAVGGGLIATHIGDVANHLPEIGMAISDVRQVKTTPRILSLTRRMNVAEVFATCGSKLQDSLVEVNNAELGALIGWPHFFNEPEAHRQPTAIGTAYGLKLAAVLGEQCHGLDQTALKETLWRLRRADGGWAARTGIGISRPEVTALVAGALAMGGCRTSQLAAAGQKFEECLLPGGDQVIMERTYVMSSVIRGLIRTNPQSPRLAGLRAALLNGAIKDPAHGNLLCWSDRMLPDRNQDRPPSMPHTAQAIVALIRLGRVLNDDARSHAALDDALRWMASHRDLNGQTEQIRRFVADNQPWDTLTVRHFTAAWVARALLLAPPSEISETDTLLIDAIHRVWGDYREGYWEWNHRERPVWMAYQGACALRDFALRTSPSV
jgi:hypothetical protein